LDSLRAWAASVPAPLKAILLVGAALAIAWNLVTPAFQGPDESAHFAYVQYFAETGHLPSATSTGVVRPEGVSSEEAEALRVLDLLPLISNVVGRPAWTKADLALWHERERALARGSRANGAGPNPIAQNPPLYYAVMAIPYRAFVWLPLLKRLFALRLFNALFYLATIVLVWLIAGELFARVRWKQTLAAGAVALQPQLAFMSGVINPDNLLIALTTGFLLAALRLAKRGPSPTRVLVPSVLASAAVLTHGRGLVTLPVLAIALVVAWIKHRRGARETLVLAALAAAPVGIAILAYSLFGRGAGSSSLYGGQVGELTAKAGFSFGQLLATTWNFYFEKFLSLHENIGPSWGYRQVFIEQFYGAFGSLEVVLPKHFSDVMQGLSAVGVAGLICAVVVRWRALRRGWPVVSVLLALLVTTLAFLHYTNYRALLNDHGTAVLFVGRYLLPMVALFGLAIAFTAGSLPRRIGPLAAAAILAIGVVVSLVGVGFTMYRFYA
jgi:4-amino-4-deoxy-L-arabinose transferase-like glycosyltransferase